MRSLTIKIKYKTYQDDVIEDFYNPVLSKSKEYCRAVGYFTSSILINYINGLKIFIKNGGKMRFIISPYLIEEDFNELSELSNEEYIEKRFVEDMKNWMFKDENTLNSSKLLILLITNGILELKISKPKNNKGMFHEKIGLFIDDNGDKIAIIGSNNETKNATLLNNESFNTFKSWIKGQDEYVQQHFNDFSMLWENNTPNVEVLDLDEAVKKKMLEIVSIDETIEALIEKIDKNNDIDKKYKFKPYDHQLTALDKWLKAKKGILKFATGSGKTKTAILIMEELKKINKKQLFIIVVPDKTLVNQWGKEILEYSDNILKCFSDEKWVDELVDLTFRYKDYLNIHQYIITTNSTFFNKEFQKSLKRFNDDYMLIVDECHTWGTERILNNLPNPILRLGLSATPELFFSESKTERLLNFFGGILQEYSLEQAIREKKLVGYYYKPIFVNLDKNEKEQYDEITKKIVKHLGNDISEFSDKYDKALEMLLFKRARIIYGAKQKLVELNKMIDAIEKKGKLLIYCGPTTYTEELDGDIIKESITQLQAVNKLLMGKGIKSAQYTSQEDEHERKIAIDLFVKQTYSTLVAIKCLDEGVDIPIIERAIILASSTNPREFIQRRGRIIRLSEGKTHSEIYDFIVIDNEYESLMKKELDRFYEFSRLAINFNEIKKEHSELFAIHKNIGGKYEE